MNTFKSGLLLSAIIFSGAACAVQSGGQTEGQSRGGQHGQPPAEALTACESLSSGDSCSFEGSNGTEAGTCFSPKEDLPLACKPANSKQGRPERGNRPSR